MGGRIMEYAYVICPKCWDKLIKVDNIDNIDSYEQKRCSKCQTRFGLALLGEKEIDNSIYKITLRYKTALDEERVANMRKAIQKLKLDADAILNSIHVGQQGSIIYEGDIIHTYLFKKAFTGSELWIGFDIIPEFPYEIYEPDLSICPECGGEVVGRTEPYDDIKGWFLDGLFCEHCNKWTLGPTAKRDTTVYKLMFPYKKIKSMLDSSIKRGIMNRLKKVPNKRIQEEKMIVYTNSERTIEIVQCLQSVGLTYDIEPSFPHKIE